MSLESLMLWILRMNLHTHILRTIYFKHSNRGSNSVSHRIHLLSLSVRKRERERGSLVLLGYESGVLYQAKVILSPVLFSVWSSHPQRHSALDC